MITRVLDAVRKTFAYLRVSSDIVSSGELLLVCHVPVCVLCVVVCVADSDELLLVCHVPVCVVCCRSTVSLCI